MSKVNISEAARLAGKSRSHLYEKYINTGAITIETDRDGRKVIDTSELIRVFGNLIDNDDTGDTQKIKSGHVGEDTKDSKIKALQTENEVLREYLRAKEDEVTWLREQVGKATALLTHKKAIGERDVKKRWWWPW